MDPPEGASIHVRRLYETGQRRPHGLAYITAAAGVPTDYHKNINIIMSVIKLAPKKHY